MSDWEKMPIPKNMVEDSLITPEIVEAMPSPRVTRRIKCSAHSIRIFPPNAKYKFLDWFNIL